MLTTEQHEFFEQNGYLVVEDVLDQSSVIDPVRREYACLLEALYSRWQSEGLVGSISDQAGFEDRLLAAYRQGCDWFQPMDISLPGERIQTDTPMHFGPAVFDLITSARLLDLVEDLIGPEIVSNPIQHVRIKPPSHDLHSNEVRAHITSTDWHQDRGVAHAEADETQMITVWCAISDATVENGCLQVLPGEHHDGLKPHCPRVQTAIADGHYDETRALPLPVKSGSVVVLHPLIPHASLINRTDRFRWSFDLRYNRSGEPTGRDHFPSFVARSRTRPETELRDWRLWRAMWEDARTRLAAAPHIDIHRWSSSAPYCA